MSLRIDAAAVRAYDQMKRRAGRARRVSDSRDPAVLSSVTRRLEELIATYRLNSQEDRGMTYVFWSEVSALVEQGALDDLAGSL